MLRKVFVHNGPIHTKLDGLTFSLYSAEEIRKLSVVKVITPLAFNALGHALPGGLYDPAMGPYDFSGLCGTCQQTFLHCPGHFGRIELPLPVINPLYSKTMLQLCRLSCLECHNVTVPGAVKYLTIAQMRLLDDGFLKEAQDAEFVVAEIMMNQGSGGDGKTRKSVGYTSADDAVARMKFEDYLRQVYKGNEAAFAKKRSFSKATSKNLENLKHAVTKRALSFAKTYKKCGHCGAKCTKMQLFESKIVYSMMGGSGGGGGGRDYPVEDLVDDLINVEMKPAKKGKIGALKYLTPMEAMNHLKKVWVNDGDFLQSLFPVLTTTTAKHPTDLFFVEVVGVPPPKNRAAQMVNNQMLEHPQNLALRHIVTSCTMLAYATIGINKGMEALSQEAVRALKDVQGANLNEKLESIWKDLQADVDHLMDRDKSRASAAQASQMIGLKQVIEKKEGLFRMHMMGKRVNYAARTVITPDPNIDTDELGIPDVFAKVLTFPTPVTHWNVHMLKKMVLNGPNVHPGAVAVENESGQISRLDPNNVHQRESIANRLLAKDKVGPGSDGVKTVYRHLMNGDYLLLNRQPSLHRPSIMAHRARVLYGDKVFRLHYANCKHYNADFDGDEMNAHFPQSHVARSEAANLVDVCSHFLVPKDGTPLAGLIQDHIVAAVRLTVRGRFFSYRDYVQLVYFGLSNYTKAIETEPPAIIKPLPLWSGKQVISTLIRNLTPAGKQPITLTSGAKIKSDEWRQVLAHPWKAGGPIKGDDLSESVVIFRHGHLLTGILDKVCLGATPFGLCHAFYELYGNKAAGALLSAFSRLMTNFLQWEGFTLGVKDVLVTPEADKIRRQLMEEAASKVGHIAAALGASLTPDADPQLVREKLEVIHRSRDPKKRAFVDLCYKKQLDQYNNQINKTCLPHGLVDIFPHNNLQLLVQSGAKGSTVNTMQMSCALGQIELEGKRPPMTISGKTLPSFVAYDVSPRAGGFIAGRFLTGIRPQEFFFHCMAGREGLIDTAVKTSRSGYLQRCLCKLLEGVVVQYDGTVRDSDGSVIQYIYGEDGLDVGKSQYLKSKQLKFLEDNSSSIVEAGVLKRIKSLGDKKKVSSAKKKISKWVGKHGPATAKTRKGGFLRFCEEMSESCSHLKGMNPQSGRTLRTEHLLDLWRKLSPEEREDYEQASSKCPDPLLSRFRPDSNYAVVSESLDNLLGKMKASGELSGNFENLIHYKAMRSLSSPGDAVGILAAQSIGEPSTQMTLNTFHFAGRGEMNVTLGIPRLREILMVASANIKTPSMDIPFLEGVSEKQAEKLRLKLTKVTMSQVLQRVEVRERVDVESRAKVHILKFIFLNGKEYSKNFCVKPRDILAYFEEVFLRQKLCPALKKTSGRKKESEDIEVEKMGGAGGGRGGGGSLNDDDIDDIGGGKDTDAFKERERKGTGEDHESSDEEPEMDDADATQQLRRARHEEKEYDAPEDEEVLKEVEDEEDEETTTNKRSEREDDEEDDDDKEYSSEIRRVSQTDYESRVGTVLALDDLIQGYEFDQEKEEWCTVEIHMRLGGGQKVNMASVIRDVAEKSVIHQTPAISRVFVVNNGDKLCLKTEGINILAMASYRHVLDLDKLHCNNVHVMAERYGIEAASKVIVKEMTDVFKVYGIVIDPRHLNLIADYMTFSGTYRPFNRIGIESSASPLQQMSFETVVSFLRDATLSGKHDDLMSPSARLVVGKPTAVGTGLFGLRNQLKPFRVKNL